MMHALPNGPQFLFRNAIRRQAVSRREALASPRTLTSRIFYIFAPWQRASGPIRLSVPVPRVQEIRASNASNETWYMARMLQCDNSGADERKGLVESRRHRYLQSYRILCKAVLRKRAALMWPRSTRRGSQQPERKGERLKDYVMPATMLSCISTKVQWTSRVKCRNPKCRKQNRPGMKENLQ